MHGMIFNGIELNFHGDRVADLVEDHGGLLFATTSQIEAADIEQLIADLKLSKTTGCNPVINDLIKENSGSQHAVETHFEVLCTCPCVAKTLLEFTSIWGS
jgi:hypothetical protein